MRKLPVNWVWVVFATGFLHRLQLASHKSAAMWQRKTTKNEIPKIVKIVKMGMILIAIITMNIDEEGPANLDHDCDGDYDKKVK